MKTTGAIHILHVLLKFLFFLLCERHRIPSAVPHSFIQKPNWRLYTGWNKTRGKQHTKKPLINLEYLRDFDDICQSVPTSIIYAHVKSKFTSGTDRIQNQLVTVKITASSLFCLLIIHAEQPKLVEQVSALRAKGTSATFYKMDIFICFLWKDSLHSSTSLNKDVTYPYSFALAIIIHFVFLLTIVELWKNKKKLIKITDSFCWSWKVFWP